MAETAPNPAHRSYHDPYDVWLISISRATIKRSRELLDETNALVEFRRHWPVVRDKEKKPPHVD